MHCFQNSSIWSVYHSDFKERFDFCELSVTLRLCVRALYSISLGRHLQCSPHLSRSASLCFTTLHFSCSPWALVAPKMNHAQHFQPRRYLWTKARPSSPSGMFDSVCSCCGHSLSSLFFSFRMVFHWCPPVVLGYGSHVHLSEPTLFTITTDFAIGEKHACFNIFYVSINKNALCHLIGWG